jgi:DNA-binding IclR family transcriptional regulator
MVTFTENTETIDSVERSLKILETLRVRESATIGEISESMDIPKSSVHSHLATLQKHGYVSGCGDLHRLSFKFLSHGEFTKRQIPMFEDISDYMEELADETGENVSFVVEDQGECIIISHQDRNHELPAATPGTRWPVHCLSAGKAILAEYPDEKVHSILQQHPSKQLTENTIADEKELFNELQRIREQEYATNRGERIERQRSVAVSIKKDTSTPIGAIAVVGPKHRMSEERMRNEVSNKLLVVSDKIELKPVS